MLDNRIAPHLTTEHCNAMAKPSGTDRSAMPDNYSHFVIADGVLGATHPAFTKQCQTFQENVAVSVQFHKISRVVGLIHRGHGATKIVLGEKLSTDRARQTRSNGQSPQTFGKAIREPHPQLTVITGIIVRRPLRQNR